MPDILNLREDFQDLLLATMLRHPGEFMYVTAAMQAKYFAGVLPTLCARAMLDHAKKYNYFPTWEVLRQRLEDETRQMPEAESSGVQDYVNKLMELETSNWEYVRDRISTWLRERALINTIKKAVDMLKEDKIPADGYSGMFLEAMQVGQNLDDLGYLMSGRDLSDVDKVVDELTEVKYGLATGFPQIDRIWKHGWGPGWLVVPAAPPKRYKCLGLYTPVLMHDGSIKLAKDIRVGDLLMGDDFKPRQVHTCGAGRGPLYSVEQKGGNPFICNDAHILCVRSTQGEVKEIEAEEYAKSGPAFQRQWQGYMVPTMVPKRRAIKVTPIGDGDYCGFTIDGNGRFLLSDFTVTHNSAFCTNLAMNVASPSIGQDVLFYACEMDKAQAMARAMCNVAHLTDDYMHESPEKFKQSVKDAMQERLIGNVLFKSFPSKNACIADLRAHAHIAVSQLGIKPRLIIIDYAETIKPSDKDMMEYRQQSSIYIEARAFAQEMKATVVMPDRVNRDTVDKPVPDARALQGAFEKAGIVDIAFGLAATDEEYLQHTIRFFNFLNRHGEAFQHLRGKVDPTTWHMDFNERIEYDPEAAQSQEKTFRRRQQPMNRRPPAEALDD